MNTPLTPARLSEIRARAEAATAGPWLVQQDPIYHMEGEADVIAPEAHAADGYGPIKSDGSYAESPGYMDVTDAAFIAAARQDVPDLLAEVDRLTAALTEARAGALEEAAEVLGIRATLLSRTPKLWLRARAAEIREAQK